MIDYKFYFNKAITYAEYLKNMKNELDTNIETQYSKYIPMNYQRESRLDKTFKLNEKIDLNTTKIKWLVISEHWCGDSSQILPIINKVAASLPDNIELKIVYRDENPDLMNEHLTNNSKSIPILMQLSNEYKFISQWGPRSKVAQELVMLLKSKSETASTYSEELHLWYAKNKQAEIVKELIDFLKLSKQ